MRASGKGVAAFLILTFGWAWLFWEGPVWLGVPVTGDLFKLLVVPGAFAPAIAALIVRAWVTREGFADAGLKLNPRKWPYYAAALLVPLWVVAFDIVLAPQLGIGQPDLSLRNGAALPFPVGGALAGSLPYGALIVAAVQVSIGALLATPFLWGEEFGWRSYLQIRIFRTRPLLAAIVTGLIWGVWHFPLLIRVPELPLHPMLTLVIFPVATVLYSIIFGWLRNRSGSIWTASLAHSAINNMRGPLLLALFAPRLDMLPIVLLSLVPLAFVALLIVAFGGLSPTSTADKNSFTNPP